MTRIAVLGANGRMGRLVVDEIARDPALQLVAAVGRAAGQLPGGAPVVPLGPGCFGDAEVVVDFSLPDALEQALPWLGPRALVSGTTGGTPAQRAAVEAHAARGPLLVEANFSLGVAVLLDLVRRAVAALPAADVEVVETHHRRKRDAPSGTALALVAAAEAARAGTRRVYGREGVTGERSASEIGVHAVRGGDIVGDHDVWLLADGERVGLSHRATSRATFAVGAVRAARFVAGRPAGRYALRDVLGWE